MNYVKIKISEWQKFKCLKFFISDTQLLTFNRNFVLFFDDKTLGIVYPETLLFFIIFS